MIPIEAYERLSDIIVFRSGKPYFSKDINNGLKEGCLAGGISFYGYRRIGVRTKGNKYLISAHRLNWFMHYKDLPMQLDHIDNDKDNNGIDNLRSVTKSQNMLNRSKLNKKCSSGHIGVHFNAKQAVWKAQCQWQGKFIYFGKFDTEKEAVAAREQGMINLGVDEYTYKTVAKMQNKI